jgi:murein DD-endopeptidase MepM/ murein hydrolase activator NlpD
MAATLSGGTMIHRTAARSGHVLGLAVAVPALCLVAALAVAAPAAATTCWAPPVDASVSDPYREPACPWCPGNRGIEYATRRGDPVRAVAAGIVRFSGEVAGVSYVVVEHADRRRVTYGRLATRAVRRGDDVVRGARIGTADVAFHFGLRVDDRYVDPTPHLGVSEGVPRLVPTDGTPAAPAPPPRVVCPLLRGARPAARPAAPPALVGFVVRPG